MFVSAILIFRRLLRTMRRAADEDGFVPLTGVGLGLIATGTVAYTLGGGWNVVDGLY